MEPKQETLGHLLRQLERLFGKMRTLSPGRDDSAKILEVIDQFRKKLRK